MKKGYLVLQNGQVFEGTAFGADVPRIGELVFTTGMCGYVETLTDPSYAGQIVLQTFPMIGNYGIIEEDFEGQSTLFGYVVREACEYPSNFRSDYNLDAYLKKAGVMGLCGVDTRQITKIVRDCGVMNAMICTTLPENLDAIVAYRVEGVVAQTTCRQESVYPAADEERFRVTLIDYGAKANIVRERCARGCRVRVVPATYDAAQILEDAPDGVMLSNGPGDPAENVFAIEQIRKIFGKVPIFGICLGHQLAALANGGQTMKLKYGHRGANQPVRDLERGHTYITSQNHGYAVVNDSVKNATTRFVNANDETCEGLRYEGDCAITAQFHPEACGGPRDTGFLFDEFIKMMEDSKHAAL